MGQCQICFSGKTIEEMGSLPQERQLKRTTQGRSKTKSRCESGNDSGHSSAESLSPNRDCKPKRCSQSSESSGKFSFRGSISSPGDPEFHHKYTFSENHPKSIIRLNHLNDDLPVFIENGEDSGDEVNDVPEIPETRSRRSRSSFSSVGSLGHFFFKRRASKWSRTTDEDEISPKEETKTRPRRAVSLRLPRSRHRKDFETKVPTVYIEDEDSLKAAKGTRKYSVRKALSLLSLNSLSRDGSTTSNKPQKPVQRILRHPTKRHTTVRGISGLGIDIRSHADYRNGLHRAYTMVYYPTNTSLRTPLRPTYSNIMYS